MASGNSFPDNSCIALVADTDRAIRKLLCVALTGAGYHVAECESPLDIIDQAGSMRPDAIILDPGSFDERGLDLIARIRQRIHAPIIVLSDSTRDLDKVAVLDAGAEDFLSKPFSVPELLARLRVVRNRAVLAASAGESSYQFGELHIDLLRKQVTLRGAPVRLSRNEYAILSVLANQAGATITPDQLLSAALGRDAHHDKHYLGVYISQLRRKLEDDPSHPRYILTESNLGYRLGVSN